MAYGDIGAVIDTFEFSITDITRPDIIQISTTIYAIAYTDADGDGQLVTVDIAIDGTITAAVVDSLEFDTTDGHEVSIIRVLDDIYAIAYRGVDADGFIVTMEITAAGAIGGAIIDSLEFETDACYEPDLVSVTDAIVAIVCRGNANQGILSTIGIDAAGNIDASPIATAQAWGTNINVPQIIHVANDVYAVVSRDAAYRGFLRTVDIDSAGTIAAAAIDTLAYNTTHATDPAITRALGDIFAITYNDDTNDAQLTTIEITTAGAIGAAVIDTLQFDPVRGVRSHVVHIGQGICLVAYSGLNADGYLTSVQTAVNGDIDASPIDTLAFDTNDGDYCALVAVAGDTYAIAYVGWGADGYLKTTPVETPPTRGPNHTLLMGIG